MRYEEWSSALSAFFFGPEQSGFEVLFAVDDSSLAEVSGLTTTAAVGSLTSAVREIVGPDWRVEIVSQMVRNWHKEGSHNGHPALPFLAFTVLAASNMGADRSFASHNYYLPLRHLLNPNDHEAGPPGTFIQNIEFLWDDVVEWANDVRGGRYGLLVVQDPGHFRYVGLAVQHALIKSADLRYLDVFFRRIGLEPGEAVSPRQLRRALAVWASGRPESWAKRLGRIASDPDLEMYCEGLLAREALRWDGKPLDPRTGRPIGRIRVGTASARRPSLQLFAQWDERLQETINLEIPSGGVIQLTRWQGWYEPRPLPELDVENALVEGIEARAGASRFRFRADDSYALAYDDDLGVWVSVDTMAYGDQYHLLVSSGALGEVLEFLRAIGIDDARAAPRVDVDLPRGWHLVPRVRIDARPRASVPSSLSSLIPAGSGPRLRLLGGLPLTGSSTGVYLRGGEPELALSSVSDELRISIKRLGTNKSKLFSIEPGQNVEVPLWELRLEPDRYEISQGEATVTIQIVDGTADAAGPGVGTITQSGIDSIEVAGTMTTAQSHIRPPVTVVAPRYPNVTVVLGGSSDDVALVGIPSWMENEIGFQPDWRTIDAWPCFEPAWQLVLDKEGKRQAAFPVGSSRPEPTGSVSGTWAAYVKSAYLAPTEDDEIKRLWDRYLATALGKSQ